MAGWMSRLGLVRVGRAAGKEEKPPKKKEAGESDPQALLDALLVESSKGDRPFEKLKETATGRRILAGRPEQSRRVVMAAVGRLTVLEKEIARIIEKKSGEGWRSPAWSKTWGPRQVLKTAVSELLRRKLPFDDSDLVEIVDWLHAATSSPAALFLPIGETARAAARRAKQGDLPEELTDRLVALKGRVERLPEASESAKMIKQLSRALGEGSPLWLQPGEAWSDRALADLAEMPPDRQGAWLRLLDHCHAAPTAARPSARWLKQARPLLEAATEEELRSRLLDWLPLVDRPRTQPIDKWPSWQPDPNRMIIPPHVDILRGLVWTSTLAPDPPLVRALTALAISAYRKVPGIGPRQVKLGNTCVWALGEIGGEDAVGQLALLKVRVRFRTAQKGIDKALGRAAEKAGVSREDLEEMGVPSYGLTAVGELTEQLGEHRARLVVTGTDSVALEWERPDGDGGWKRQKSVPAAVKRDFGDDLKELKAAVKDVRKMLPAQRARIEAAYLKRKSWAFDTWRECYLDHALVGTLARRLIWEFDAGDGPKPGIWIDGNFVDAAGDAVGEAGADAQVGLWHPIGRSVDEIMAWRRFLEARQIRQPFKQAHREVYLLTDAERQTRIYSNRFAAHVVRQHQVNALCAARGWKSTLQLMVDDVFPPPSLEIPADGLRAEFWTNGLGDRYGEDTNEAGVYLYLATDQVRFYRLDSPETLGSGYHGGPSSQADPVPLEDIPPLVLSEVLRDVDLFVGVGSVGNDPGWADGGPDGAYAEYWQRYSFGELSETAKTRRDTLSRLLPRLQIADRCELDDRFLRVRGRLRKYKIHLGSGNIMMTPTNRYLCIVPARSRATVAAGRVYLPFEGDTTMSVILSKAFLLAEDHKIKDPTIAAQLVVP